MTPELLMDLEFLSYGSLYTPLFMSRFMPPLLPELYAVPESYGTVPGVYGAAPKYEADGVYGAASGVYGSAPGLYQSRYKVGGYSSGQGVSLDSLDRARSNAVYASSDPLDRARSNAVYSLESKSEELSRLRRLQLDKTLRW